MLKKVTRIHLTIARFNKSHPIFRPLTPAGRRELASWLRWLRRNHGAAEARRLHRTYYGPQLSLEE